MGYSGPLTTSLNPLNLSMYLNICDTSQLISISTKYIIYYIIIIIYYSFLAKFFFQIFGSDDGTSDDVHLTTNGTDAAKDDDRTLNCVILH